MKSATIINIYSQDFLEIRLFFQDNKPPYTLQDIFKFNRLYRHAYPRLSREERLRSEELIDQFIAGLEDRRLANKIFGVV